MEVKWSNRGTVKKTLSCGLIKNISERYKKKVNFETAMRHDQKDQARG